jgi:hypothetical protein
MKITTSLVALTVLFQFGMQLPCFADDLVKLREKFDRDSRTLKVEFLDLKYIRRSGPFARYLTTTAWKHDTESTRAIMKDWIIDCQNGARRLMSIDVVNKNRAITSQWKNQLPFEEMEVWPQDIEIQSLVCDRAIP